MKIHFAPIVFGAALSAFVSTAAIAQDGGALYKTKCAMCHGDQGQGKAKLGVKLAGTTKSEASIAAVLTKGGGTKAPHLKGINGLSADQATSVAVFVKTLK